MPAPRLPWYRFWVGATAHGKVRQLDDGMFRTWVELLDAAAQQPTRGRFASRQEAVSIVRRPAKHVAALIAATLIDESSEGLTMHDWDEWQRWRKEDANDSPTTPERPPNGHVNDSRTTLEDLRNGPSSRARVRGDVDTDVDREEEKEKEEYVPPATQGAPNEKISKIRAIGNPRVAALIDAFRDMGEDVSMSERDRAAVKNSNAAPVLIAEAYAAVAHGEYGDDFMLKRLSVHAAVDWVNGYVAHRGAGVRSTCTCAEGRAQIAISRNCFPECAVHGDVRELLKDAK